MAILLPEHRDFLLGQVHTGKLATVRADGRPHVVPIWYELDDDTIVFSTWHTSVKANNIRHDPRVSMCVDDERPPFTYIMIEGMAELTSITGDALLPWATRIARRYMGDAQGETYGKRNAVPGEVLVRMTPTRVIWQKDIAS